MICAGDGVESAHRWHSLVTVMCWVVSDRVSDSQCSTLKAWRS